MKRGASPRIRARLLAVLCALPVALACAPNTAWHAEVEGALRARHYDAALKSFYDHRDNYGDEEELLALFEEGALLFYAGRMDEALAVFHRADAMGEYLYADSISRGLGSFLFNDTVKEYPGEDFERVMVNVFKALIYIVKGDREGALVECRKIDEKLREYARNYTEWDQSYREDGFARLLSGILYEGAHTSLDNVDALVDYRKALETYRDDYTRYYGFGPPEILRKSAGEMAARLGEETPAGALAVDRRKTRRMQAELVVVHLAGKIPEKKEEAWVVPFAPGYVFSVAYPVYRRREFAVTGSIIHVTAVRGADSAAPVAVPAFLKDPPLFEGTVANTENVQPLGAIATKALDDRIAGIKVKAIARATAKYAAVYGASQALYHNDDTKWIGLLVHIFGTLFAVGTERADTRSWLFLPDRINLARIPLDAGEYEVRAELTNGETLDLGRVQLRGEGQKVIVFATLY